MTDTATKMTEKQEEEMFGSPRKSEEIGEASPLGQYQTKRGLSPRHVQLMAIGGSIGTGLWVSEQNEADRSATSCFTPSALLCIIAH